MNRKIFSALAAFGLAALLAASAAPAGASDPGVLEVYDSLEDFLVGVDEVSVLVHEDFNAERMPLGGFSQSVCDNPQNSSTGTPATNFVNQCFGFGELAEGFSVRTDDGSLLWMTGTNGAGGNRETNVLGSLPGMAATLLDFSDPPTAVALDLYQFMGVGTIMVEVFAIDGALMGTLEVNPPSVNEPSFAGFSAPAPIGRVRLMTTNPGAPESIGEMYFGGGPGRLEASVESIEFGRITVDSEASQTVELFNSGFLDLYMESLPEPDEPFVLTGEDCSGVVLAPGEQCSVTYAFQPQHVGNFGHDVALSAGGAFGDTLGLALAGEAMLPELSIVPARWNFAAPGDDTLEVRLVNHESVSVTVEAILAPAEPFSGGGGDCPEAPFELEPGGSCTLGFGYGPAAPGRHAASVLIATDDPAGVRAIHLSGRLDGPEMVISPASLDFGSVAVGQMAEQILEITSAGTTPLGIDAFEIPLPFERAGGDCPEAPFDLAPGSDCTLAVRFAPAAPGAVSDDLVIDSNLPSTPTHVGLSGTGTEAGVSVSPDVAEFGPVVVNQTESVTLTVANTGSAELQVIAVGGPDAPFSLVGGTCPESGFTLPAGADCSIEVAFSPEAIGAHEGAVTVDTAVGLVTVPLGGSGVEVVDEPRLRLESGTSIDFGQVAVDAGSEAVVVIRNTGGQALEVTGLMGPSAPFSLAQGDPDACVSVPFELAPAQACSMVVLFEPVAAGFYADGLVLESNAPSSPDEVTLQGEALAGQAQAPIAVPTLERTALLALILLMLAVTGWKLKGARRVRA